MNNICPHCMRKLVWMKTVRKYGCQWCNYIEGSPDIQSSLIDWDINSRFGVYP